MHRKQCIAVREDKWKEYLRAFPHIPVYVEDPKLASVIQGSFSRRKINLLYPSLRGKVEEEVQQYLPSDIAALVLAHAGGQEREVFVREWGRLGRERGQFDHPIGIAGFSYDYEGKSYDAVVVADSRNHRIQVFESDGEGVYAWGRRGTKPGEFSFPGGISTIRTSHSDYEVIVADTHNHRIQVFDVEGKFLRMWGAQQGGAGSEAGEFSHPESVSTMRVGSSYEVIVADTRNHRIQVFNSEGKFLRMWGKRGNKRGELDYPMGVGAFRSPGTSLSSYEIAVVDAANYRIQVFNSEGQFLRMWGSEGRGAGEFNSPRGVGIFRSPSGSSDEIFVADTWNHRIQVFTREGEFLRMWGKHGLGDGEFNNPYGITMLPSGELVVADTHNNRVQVFQTVLE